jgi:hypothetical protein
VSGIKSTFIVKKKTNKRKYKPNTFYFRKKHYEYRSGIKSSYIGKKKKRKNQINGNIDQIPWDSD